MWFGTLENESTINIMPNSEIENLKRELNQLKSDFESFRKTVEYKGDSEKVSDEFLRNKVFDIFWKRVFHYFAYFEDLTGYVTSTVGAGNITNNFGQFLLFETGALANNHTALLKYPHYQSLLTFATKGYFRTKVLFGDNANQIVYIHVGDEGLGSGSVLGFYGFRVINATLYGETDNGTSGTQLALMTITPDTVEYNLEARYYPNERVVFFVDNVEKGTITTTLPKPLDGAEDLFQIYIETTDAAVKSMELSFWEYLQERNRIK